MAAIVVPINNGEGAVELEVDELPPYQDIVNFLDEERAALPIWMDVAVQYYKHNRIEDFEGVIQFFQGKVPDYCRSDKSGLIALYNVFASYYIRQGRTVSDKQKAKGYFNQATRLFSEADKIDSKEEITWVCKGFLFLFKNEPGRAGKQFQELLAQNPNNIPALLGSATVLFQDQKYTEACNLYKKVIKLNPDCPPSVRVGLANCFFKLNQPELCKIALERVLELETDDEVKANALVGLAVVAKNEGRYDLLGNYVKEAIKISGQHPKALNLAAGIYFSRGELNISHRSAIRAFNSTAMPKVQAESCYALGRCYHAQSDYSSALKYYQQATSRWGDFVLPQFGLGQMYIQQKETDKAIKAFEKVIELAPDNYETMKILGSLYITKNETEKAVTLLTKAVTNMPNDLEALLELAQVLETTDYRKALQYYLQAIKHLRREEKDVPREIWNNVGLLLHQTEAKVNFVKAEAFYRRALTGNYGNIPTDEELDEMSKNQSETRAGVASSWDVISILNGPEYHQLLQDSNVTILFNIARLYEDISEVKKATALYQAILKEFPSYSDCYMRLGYIEQQQNHLDKAEKWFREVLTTSNSSKDAQLAIANLNLSKKDQKKAQDIYESITKDDKYHPYACLSLANLYLTASTDDPARKERCLRYAMDFFFRVLSRDKSNIYAANGLALIHIHHERLADGKECLLQIREACGNMKLAPVWINLAHVNLQQKHYETAIRLYQTCIHEFGEGVDENIYLYISKAYFDSGNLTECKKSLSQALRLRPWDNELWFNLGITMHKNARQVLDNAKSNYAQMKSAINDFQAALSILDRLASLPPPPQGKRAFDSKQCAKLSSVARANIGEYEDKLRVVSEKEKEKLREQETKLEQAERLRREKDRQMEVEEEERQLKQRQLEEEARLLEEKRNELAQKWTQITEEKAREAEKKKAKRRPKADSDQGEEEPEQVEEDAEPKKRKRKSKAGEEGGKERGRTKKRKLQSRSQKLDEDVMEDVEAQEENAELGLEEDLFGASSGEEDGEKADEEKGGEENGEGGDDTTALAHLFPSDDSDEDVERVREGATGMEEEGEDAM